MVLISQEHYDLHSSVPSNIRDRPGGCPEGPPARFRPAMLLGPGRAIADWPANRHGLCIAAGSDAVSHRHSHRACFVRSSSCQPPHGQTSLTNTVSSTVHESSPTKPRSSCHVRRRLLYDYRDKLLSRGTAAWLQSLVCELNSFCTRLCGSWLVNTLYKMLLL